MEVGVTRTAVKSSNVVSLGHDGTALEVEFAGGKVYRYPGVPSVVFQQVLGAPSVGKALALHVIGKYAHERIGGNDGSTR